MSDPEGSLLRASVRDLDLILGSPFKVLDDGFVRVIDYMGSDRAIVQAARVSYGKGTRKTHEDRGLVRYLMRHRHTTPFEMCEIKLHLRVPMDTWRQWIRHRSANVNEYSTRYSIAIDAAQRTDPEAWRVQAAGNRQGSDGFVDRVIGEQLSNEESAIHGTLKAVYARRLELGVAREQARKDLPLSTYTEAYWKIDLHNLLHFLSLRMEMSAQLEIRTYAEVIGHEIVRRWCPLAWEAFLDYRVNALNLSRLELEVVGAIHAGNIDDAVAAAERAGWLKQGDDGLKPNRERAECEAKLRRLRMSAPWENSLKGGLKREEG